MFRRPKKDIASGNRNNLSTDCWTSVTMDAFIGVTAHFINNDFEFKSVVPKCSVMHGGQTSLNLASVLRNTCMEWGILDKINFCVTDNAANIVGAINILGWTHCGCMALKLNFTLQHPLRILDDTLKKVKKIVTYYRASYKAKEKLMEYQAKVQGASQPLVLIKFSANKMELHLFYDRTLCPSIRCRQGNGTNSRRRFTYNNR